MSKQIKCRHERYKDVVCDVISDNDNKRLIACMVPDNQELCRMYVPSLDIDTIDYIIEMFSDRKNVTERSYTYTDIVTILTRMKNEG